MMNSSFLRSQKLPAQRRGVTIILVIAFYAIAVTLLGVWIRAVLAHRQQVIRWQERVQATWLAESGVRRAVARIGTDTAYAGEHWQIAADEIGGKHSAEVVIRFEPVVPLDPSTALASQGLTHVRVTATANYPAGAERRVRFTKSTEITVPAGVDLSEESS